MPDRHTRRYEHDFCIYYEITTTNRRKYVDDVFVWETTATVNAIRNPPMFSFRDDTFIRRFENRRRFNKINGPGTHGRRKIVVIT